MSNDKLSFHQFQLWSIIYHEGHEEHEVGLHPDVLIYPEFSDKEDARESGMVHH